MEGHSNSRGTRSLDPCLKWSYSDSPDNREYSADGSFEWQIDGHTKIVSIRKVGPEGVTAFAVKLPFYCGPTGNIHMYPHPDGKSVGFGFHSYRGRMAMIFEVGTGELLWESDPKAFRYHRSRRSINNKLFIIYLSDQTFLLSDAGDYSLIYQNYQLKGIQKHGQGGTWYLPEILEDVTILGSGIGGLSHYLFNRLHTFSNSSFYPRDMDLSRMVQMFGYSYYVMLEENRRYSIRYNDKIGGPFQGSSAVSLIKDSLSRDNTDGIMSEYQRLFDEENTGQAHDRISVIRNKTMMVLLVRYEEPFSVAVTVLDRRFCIRYSKTYPLDERGRMPEVILHGKRVAVIHQYIEEDGEEEEREKTSLEIFEPLLPWTPSLHSLLDKEEQAHFTGVFAALYYTTSLPTELLCWIMELTFSI